MQSPTPPADAPAPPLIQKIAQDVAAAFEQQRAILTFPAYLELMLSQPRRHLRSAVEFLRDMFLYFGQTFVPGPTGPIKRWRLFDAPFDEGRDQVFGQEAVQKAVFQFVQGFVDKGAPDKMLLLTGPNGSAKTSIIALIMRGLEVYSDTEEGPLFSFNWIFSDRDRRQSLGFDAAPDQPLENFALLSAEDITHRFACELRDPPIFLAPREHRAALLERAAWPGGDDRRLGRAIAEGELCQKCHQIYSALLTAYHGDWERVMRHVQVCRYRISRRYRVGAVSIEPQRNVDANVRPVPYEFGANLPAELANLNLFEPVGDLVDACGGVVEYSDFLKRAVETNKYLLTTCERNTITLPGLIAYLNTVIFGTTNEKHLSHFKLAPEFSSFKGRIEIIPAPYLLRYQEEARIYDAHLTGIAGKRHVAPHTTKLTALWAVMTRLRRPRDKHFGPVLGPVVSRLTPLWKARLYNDGHTPPDLRDHERRALAAGIDDLRREYDDVLEKFEGMIEPTYEGRRGASPREMMTVLQLAAESPRYACLSPLALFEALLEFSKNTTLYDFLRLEPDYGYNDPKRFCEELKVAYREIAEREVNDALGLMDEAAMERVFVDYFQHVKAAGRGEKVRSRITQNLEPPDEKMMGEMEAIFGRQEEAATFRQNLIARIGAYHLDHPDRPIDYARLFPDMLQAVKNDFYAKRRRQIETLRQNILRHGTEDFQALPSLDREVVRQSLQRMAERYGYCTHCAKDVISFVVEKATSG